MLRKNIIYFFLLTITAVFTSLLISEASHAQNNTVQNNVENNNIEFNTNLSKSMNSELAIANNNSDPIFINDYFKDFRMNNDTDPWTIQSGNWNYTSDGLHGGSSEAQVNNIILSPIAPFGNEFDITTLFKINNLDENMPKSTSIVYSFIDNRNYEQAGIHISNNDVYLVLSKAANNIFEYVPEYPGIKTDLTWESDSVFNMTLSSEDDAKHILLNGTGYSFDDNDTNKGLIGLSYGGINSLDFLTYEYQKSNNTITDDAFETQTSSNTITDDAFETQTSSNTITDDAFETQTSNEVNVTDSMLFEEVILPTTTTEGLITFDGSVNYSSPSAEPGGEVREQTDNIEIKVSTNTITKDSQTILLDGKTLPEGSYIHLYDSTPYQIMSGHITAKFPCNDDGTLDVNVLTGQAPNLQPTELEFVEPWSTSGELCHYRADVASDETTHITDIAIQNNSTDDIEFPETSSINISVGEISKTS